MSDAYLELSSVQPITFEEFWQAYPRRQKKKEASKAWAKVSPVHHQQILSALEQAKQTEQWRKEKGTFIPLPASWLNGERWNDEMKVDFGRPPAPKPKAPEPPVEIGKPPPLFYELKDKMKGLR